MIVYLYRHALADFSKKQPRTDEFGPGLTEEGRSQVARISGLVGPLGVRAQKLITSPLRRARETAELALGNLFEGSELVVSDSLLGDATPEQVFDEINAMKPPGEIALVTHYPLIGKFITKSLGYKYGSELSNGAIMRIDFKGKADQGKGTLVWVVPAL